MDYSRYELHCAFCGLPAWKIKEYSQEAYKLATTAEEVVRELEVTYSPGHNLFCCTNCFQRAHVISLNQLLQLYEKIRPTETSAQSYTSYSPIPVSDVLLHVHNKRFNKLVGKLKKTTADPELLKDLENFPSTLISDDLNYKMEKLDLLVQKHLVKQKQVNVEGYYELISVLLNLPYNTVVMLYEPEPTKQVEADKVTNLGIVAKNPKRRLQ